VVASVEDLRTLGLQAGLCAVGVCASDPFPEIQATIEARRDQGLHARMQFTYRNPARSTNPQRTLPGGQRLIVGAYDYQRQRPDPPQDQPLGRVAAYSWEDHYATLRVALEEIAQPLRQEGYQAVVLADQNHLVDRGAAYRAGIGWWGKSTNILVPGVGSLVVLGSVLTDAPIELADAPHIADGCSSCTKCLDGCPTGAIIAPGVIDARRCLAWLVQDEGIFPVEYRAALGDRIYGCDECQDVCPPNQIRQRRPSNAGAAGAWVPLLDLLEADDSEILDRYGRWYIPKREPNYLRRNALLALANAEQHRATPRTGAVIETHLRHRSAMVRAHAVWAARALGLAHLLDIVADDTDADVLVELARP
jgi:epoxyqueuosine reductase